jgi:hypothetical protein
MEPSPARAGKEEADHIDRFVDLAAWLRVAGQFFDGPEPHNGAVHRTPVSPGIPQGQRKGNIAAHDSTLMQRAVDFRFHSNSSFSPSPAAALRASQPLGRRVFAPLYCLANCRHYQALTTHAAT